MSRKFVRGKNDKYSLVEKDELGNLCKKYKDEYDAKIDEYKKQVNWNWEKIYLTAINGWIHSPHSIKFLSSSSSTIMWSFLRW